MKSIIAACLFSASALVANAIPTLTLDFTQTDWVSNVQLTLSGPLPGDFYIDEVLRIGFGNGGGFQGYFTVGTHTTSAIVQGTGEEVFGPNFVVVPGDPGTVPDEFIVTPDSGQTGTLLAFAGIGVLAYHRRRTP